MSVNWRYFTPSIRRNITCLPTVVVNHKTHIPRTLALLPLDQPIVEEDFRLMFPHFSCVTAPMIWFLRQQYGREEFQQWYTRLTGDRANWHDLRRLEQWFIQTPTPEPTEMIPPVTSNPFAVHSGWLVDLPGLNPRMGEDYYMRLFQVPNVYHWVLKYRSQPTHLSPTLRRFLREVKIVV